MGQTFTIDGVAKGVTAKDFHEWYTDFRSDDPELIKEIGERQPIRVLERKVTRDGNRLLVDQRLDFRGRPVFMRGEMVVHPEDYTYDIASTSTGAFRMKDTRHYTFREVPGGAEVRADCELSDFQGAVQLVAALGLVRKSAQKKSQEVLEAYCRAAERELAGRKA